MRVSILLLLINILCSCSNTENTTEEQIIEHNSVINPEINWFVNEDHLIGEFQPFPEIDSIIFQTRSTDLTINKNHRVAIINLDNTKIAFLYGDLAYYESLNFNINGKNYAITHCPITNTTIAFELDNQNKIRASGYRLNDNLVFFNSTTKDFISQMQQQTIGSLKNNSPKILKPIPILDTEWDYVEKLPNLLIASVQDKDLGTYNLPVTYNNNELLFDNLSISLNLDHIKKEIDIIELNQYEECFLINFNNNVLVGNKSLKTINIFNTELAFTFSDSKNHLIDEFNNKYDYTGYCFEGSRKGTQLNILTNYLGSTHAFEQLFNTVNKNKL